MSDPSLIGPEALAKLRAGRADIHHEQLVALIDALEEARAMAHVTLVIGKTIISELHAGRSVELSTATLIPASDLERAGGDAF